MKTLLLLFCMFCCVPLWSQLEINMEIDFNAQFGQEYLPLEEFTNLTEGMGAWDDNIYDYFELMTPLVMPGFEDRPMNYSEVDIHGNLYIDYSNWPEDPYYLSFAAVAVDDFVISPLNDDNNTDQGHILFYEGDGLVIFEYQNVAFEEEMYLGDGNLTSRANFQVELHLEDLCVQFNYGPSNLGPEIQQYLSDEMIVGTGFGWDYYEEINGNLEYDFLALFGIISGNPNDPQFHQLWIDLEFDEDEIEYLSAFPEEGTVYRFCYSETTSVNELSAGESTLRLFPNPASTELFVDLSDSDLGALNSYVIQIVDIQGKVLLEKELESHQSLVDIESLSKGLYLLRIKGDHFTEVKKFFKH